MVESLLHLFEAMERMPRKRVEPVVGGVFEIGGEHVTQEEIIMRIDRHLVLILLEMLDGIGHSGVVFELAL